MKSEFESRDCRINLAASATAAKCGKKSSTWCRKRRFSPRGAHSAHRGVNPKGRRQFEHPVALDHWNVRYYLPSLMSGPNQAPENPLKS